MNAEREAALQATIKELEQRLEIALLCANQVWWEWDIPTSRLKTHAIKDCILGYDLGQIRHHLDFWMDALPPEEREPAWQSLQEHFRGETEMWVMEHQYRDPHGEYKWVLEAGKLISRNPDGSPLRMVGITQNIHEKKMRDQELKAKNEQLASALKLKDVVLATVSHDVINALSAGWEMAELLQEEVINQTEEFKLIEESLSQSLKLISSIHELATGELVEIERSEVDATSIISESRDFHAPIAKNKGLEFHLNTQGANLIVTDGLALRRILDNLIGNAIKFTQNGYIAINDVSTACELIIEVSDSGMGIPPEKEHLLFIPFQKLTNTPHGSGLGMSICQNLAKQSSGMITYRPNQPAGSIFRVEIPRN
jgi:PAS domain S-box-containing protein